ncbi:VOC family protein [Methylocystis sp. JAN1]|uniref:VOC family protein n=1 Tax=Methylocystis sp. JAN1 TaxID=3397211 RepID=UPI003FA2ED52
MFSHIFVGVSDFNAAVAFYAPLMAQLGRSLKFVEQERPWAGWSPAWAERPLFLIGRPFEGAPAPGNGQMVAFIAPDRAMVDACHALALANGGSCEGPPGLRPHYHPHYYGAYFRDPDGNKLCVCCHDPA